MSMNEAVEYLKDRLRKDFGYFEEEAQQIAIEFWAQHGFDMGSFVGGLMEKFGYAENIAEIVALVFMSKNSGLSFLKDKLVRTFGYGEDEAIGICSVFEDIVAELGSEYAEVVVSSVINTKISFTKYQKNGIRETVKTVLEREGLSLPSDNKGISISDVRSIESIYISQPNVVFENGQFSIAGVKRAIVINSPFVEGSPSIDAMLKRELLCAVVSNIGEYSTHKDELVVRQGLMERREQLSVDGDGQITRTLISEKGYGLENGIRDRERSFDSQNYSLSLLATLRVLEEFQLEESIQVARVAKATGALRALIDVVLEGGYDKLIASFDTFYDLEKTNIASRIGDRESAMKAADELENYYSNVIKPMLQNLKQGLKVAMQNQSVKTTEGNTI